MFIEMASIIRWKSVDITVSPLYLVSKRYIFPRLSQNYIVLLVLGLQELAKVRIGGLLM